MGEAGGPRAGPGSRVGLAAASSVDAYESHGVWSTEQRVDPCFSESCCADSPTHRDLFVTPNNTPALSQSLGDAWGVNALISPLGSRRSKQATLCLLVSALRLKTKACLTVCLVQMFVGFVGDFSVSAAPKGSVEAASGVLCPRRLGRALCGSPGPDRQAGAGTVGRGSREDELMLCVK